MLNIEKKKEGSKLELVLAGRLDTTTAPELEKELKESLDGVTDLTFDLEKLWDYHLQPLLEEYLGNRVEDKEIKDLLQSIRDEFTKPLK